MKLIAAVSCAFLALATSPLSGATIQGGRIDNLACDNGFFSVTAGPQTIKVQKFAIYAYHQEKTKYYVYYHAGELEDSIRTDATQWTLLSTTEVQPTGLDNAFELSAGGTFIAANEVGSFMITADLANDNGAIWGGKNGELSGSDLSVSLVKWFIRLGDDANKAFTLTRACGNDAGFGGIITYEVVGGVEEGKTITGGRINNLACDNGYFAVTATATDKVGAVLISRAERRWDRLLGGLHS